MATARAITPEQWNARALELAEAQHLTGTARELAGNETHQFFGVRKSSVTGEYIVRVTRGHVSCDCVAGQHGHACKHAGAVLHTLQMRERATSQPDTDPLAHWRRGFDW